MRRDVSIPDWSKVFRIIQASFGNNQGKFVSAMGVSRSYMYLLRTGKRIPSKELVKRLAQVSGLTVETLQSFAGDAVMDINYKVALDIVRQLLIADQNFLNQMILDHTAALEANATGKW